MRRNSRWRKEANANTTFGQYANYLSQMIDSKKSLSNVKSMIISFDQYTTNKTNLKNNRLQKNGFM